MNIIEYEDLLDFRYEKPTQYEIIVKDISEYIYHHCFRTRGMFAPVAEHRKQIRRLIDSYMINKNIKYDISFSDLDYADGYVLTLILDLKTFLVSVNTKTYAVWWKEKNVYYEI